MADQFSRYATQLDSPASNAASVTPDDDTDLAHATRGLYVGGAGNVAVNMIGTGTAIVFVAVPAGTLLPIRAARVKSTGTTATSIVAVW